MVWSSWWSINDITRLSNMDLKFYGWLFLVYRLETDWCGAKCPKALLMSIRSEQRHVLGMIIFSFKIIFVRCYVLYLISFYEWTVYRLPSLFSFSRLVKWGLDLLWTILGIINAWFLSRCRLAWPTPRMETWFIIDIIRLL